MARKAESCQDLAIVLGLKMVTQGHAAAGSPSSVSARRFKTGNHAVGGLHSSNADKDLGRSHSSEGQRCRRLQAVSTGALYCDLEQLWQAWIVDSRGAVGSLGQTRERVHDVQQGGPCRIELLFGG